MNSNTQRLKRRELLSSSRCPRGDKSTEHFASKGLFYPESAGGVPECLPLGGEVTVSGGDSYRLERTAKCWGIAMQGGGYQEEVDWMGEMRNSMRRDRGDTEEETVVLGEGVGGCDWDVRFGWSIHLTQDILRQSLRNSTRKHPSKLRS
jgi:hypothetical protein